MSISFTPDQINNITAEQLQVAANNVGLQASVSAMSAQQAANLSADNATLPFYNSFTGQAASYESELNLKTGLIASEYTNTDVTNSAQLLTDSLFFPNNSTTQYIYCVPRPVNAINGVLYPTGTSTSYEQLIESNSANPYNGITQIINYLDGSLSGSGVAPTTGTVPAGPSTGIILTYSGVGGDFTVGQTVGLYSGSSSGLYQITAITSTGVDPDVIVQLTLNSIIPTLIGMTNPTVTGTVPAFTLTERQTLTGAGNFQELLTTLTSQLYTLLSANLLTNLNSQLTQISSNTDSRPTQLSQLSAETSAINSFISQINSYLSLPATGSNGRYIQTNTDLVLSYISARQSIISTRIAQITSALGQVSVSGNSFTSTDLTCVYYMRYQWLNIRINRLSGTLTKYYTSQNGAAAVQILATNNQMLLNNYASYFITQAVESRNATTTVRIASTASYNVGDRVYFITNTLPPIMRAIMKILDTKQIVIDNPLPANYLPTTSEKLRLYKQLT